MYILVEMRHSVGTAWRYAEVRTIESCCGFASFLEESRRVGYTYVENVRAICYTYNDRWCTRTNEYGTHVIGGIHVPQVRCTHTTRTVRVLSTFMY